MTAPEQKNRKCGMVIAALIIAAGAVLRLAAAMPGLLDSTFPERFTRPDTPGYLLPALSLFENGIYDGTGRAPGFPVLLAGCFRLTGGTGLMLPVLLLLLFSVLTIAVVYLAGRVYDPDDRRSAYLAAGFCALNLTAIANAPMLLTDTFFGLIAAIQWLIFLKAWREKRPWLLPAAAAAAALGALIRPINSAWIVPLLVLVLLMPQISRRHKLAAAAASLAIFLLIPLPWMFRNRAAGAGMVIDTNTGAMYHQNGAMLLAEVNNSDFEAEKARILAEQRELFTDTVRFPDEKSREEWRLARFRELIAAHPLIWFRQHLKWHILLPDAPGLLEISGITTANRGTMAVLAHDGILAAVRHYFGSHMYMLLLLIPLLAVTGAMYLGAAALFCRALLRIREHKYFFEVLVILAFAEYYFFLPGPITAPRYQIPALPCLCVLAGFFFVHSGIFTAAARLRQKIAAAIRRNHPDHKE